MTDILAQSAVLLESRTARDAQLSRVTPEAANARLQAQGLIMASWKSERLATTAQIAEFYGVSVDVVQASLKYHRTEFESDGLRVLRGKALKEVMEIFSISSNTPNLTVWTPRAAMRLGYFLRESPVALALRDSFLDMSEKIPAMVEEMEVMRLKLEVLTMEKALLDKREWIATALPEHQQQKILGYQVVEKVEYRDRIIKNDELIRDGSTINKSAICYRLGILKNGKPDYPTVDRLIAAQQFPKDAWEGAIFIRENKELKIEYFKQLERAWDDQRGQRYLGE